MSGHPERELIIGDKSAGGVIARAEFHPKLLEHLQALLETGHYGNTVADVALRLVERGAREAAR